MKSLNSRGAGPRSVRRYRMERVIGRGSFGTAYLVRSQKDSRLYVMKRLEFEHMPEKDRAEAHNECEVLMKLRHHPNIIRVHEYFMDQGRLCILMDYADGGDLAQRIEAQAAAATNFSEDQVLDWFVQICLALKHAHDRKVLHRDLKPQNIFLTRKNLVRLGDFGISRVLSSTMSVASTCVGTPLYLSPELCEGKDYNNKGDMWSVGVILYELIALHPPFTAAVMPALVMRICCDPVPPLPAHASDELRAIASKLLLKDPVLRPRVHDVLAEPFIQQRIERLLPAEALLHEFAHTVLHSPTEEPPAVPSAPPPRATKPAAAAAASKQPRAKPPPAATVAATRKATPPARVGRGGCAPGAGGAGGAGGTPGGASPGGRDGGDDELVRLQQRREADERRETMRRQIRQDRTQAGARHEGGGIAVELVLGAHQQPSQPNQQPNQRLAPPASPPAVSGVASCGDALVAGLEGQSASHEPQAVRRALEAANPGTRLLVEDERRAVHAAQDTRRMEVMDRVQASRVKGEAGRALLNRAQRELLTISRVLGAVSKAYVLVRLASSAEPPLTVVGVDGVSVDEVGLLDSADAEVDHAGGAARASGADSDFELDEPSGGPQEAELPVDTAGPSDALDAPAVGACAQPERRNPSSAGEEVSVGAPTATPALERTQRAPLAWEISPPAAELPRSGGGAPMPVSAERRTGGVAFDIAFDGPPSVGRQASHVGGASRLAPPAAERSRSAEAAVQGGQASRAELPTHLFSGGSSLSSKVETLRMHLEQNLGGQAALQKVLSYVVREESGEQREGEREEMLSFMADQKSLLPLVHTLLYLEEALGVR